MQKSYNNTSSQEGRQNNSGSKPYNRSRKPRNASGREESYRPSRNKFSSRGGRPGGNRQHRQGRIQKTMDPDYSILVKKATPQAIEDYVSSKTFTEHGLHSSLVSNLDQKGYTQPTAIQDKSIPHILNKKDIIGIANTGTGKTAAFLLPLIHQIHENPKKKILILAPTRELVAQIDKELRSFTKGTKIRSTVVIGGVAQVNQVRELHKNKNFIISTPGRGLDLIEQGKLPISDMDTIVLDEMDQMLDMGFIKDIRKILSLATKKQHLLFFSATNNKNVDTVARQILNDPILVSVVKGKTTDNVNQDVVEIGPEDDKFEKLCEILSRPEVEKAIVFENTKHGSAKIEKQLSERGFKTLAIHGNKNQNQRTRALDAFKKGKIDILIATNVAARGLDIPLVSHVINYSLPQNKDDYIHRIGRTGRAGEVGQAYTFVPKPRQGRR